MSKHQAIARALSDWLDELPMSPGLPIVKNIEEPYNPEIGSEYLETRLLTGSTNTLAVGQGRFQYTGILQVTVIYPRNSGIELALGIVDMIIDHFKKGTIIDGDGVRVKINRQPDQATPTGDGAWLRVPVSVNYQCMA